MSSQFDDKKRLIEALCSQEIIGCNKKAAKKIASVVSRKPYEPGNVIISQDDVTNEMYFILSGEVLIEVNKRPKAIRHNGQQVGEMALVNVGKPRSATVIAKTKCELAKIEAHDFVKIANKLPDLWKNIAKSLADRLFQRNALERQKNEIPQIFIASSAESKKYLTAIQNCLDLDPYDMGLIPWTKGDIFHPTSYTMIDLEAQAKQVDFAIIILGPDDKVISREIESDAPRDNVILEAGLFMGALGLRRTFLVIPDKTLLTEGTVIKMPSDFQGITTLRFGERPIADICNDIIRVVKELGSI